MAPTGIVLTATRPRSADPSRSPPGSRRRGRRFRSRLRLGLRAWALPSTLAAVAGERIEVDRVIEAQPAAVFAVLCDPQGHVAIDSSGMLMSASGDPVTAVGDTFVVHMDREALNDYPLGKYDVTVRIVAFEPDTEIAWTPEGQLNLGHVYGYRLEPADGGTKVTSYYDWSTVEQSWKDANIFPIIPESALRATLGILARTVQRPGGR